VTFIPGKALATATREALKVFARHKPAIFKLASEDSEAADAYIADYARALLGVTLEAIPEAAQRWVANKTEIASPASFGLFARGIDAEEFRAKAPSHSLASKKERWPGARAFWFDREGPKDAAGQWDAHHAIAFAVPGVGSIGISDREMERLYDRTAKWGWVEDRDLPAWARDMLGRGAITAEAAPMETLL
jgi:hypothetical protein